MDLRSFPFSVVIKIWGKFFSDKLVISRASGNFKMKCRGTLLSSVASLEPRMARVAQHQRSQSMHWGLTRCCFKVLFCVLVLRRIISVIKRKEFISLCCQQVVILFIYFERTFSHHAMHNARRVAQKCSIPNCLEKIFHQFVHVLCFDSVGICRVGKLCEGVIFCTVPYRTCIVVYAVVIMLFFLHWICVSALSPMQTVYFVLICGINRILFDRV